MTTLKACVLALLLLANVARADSWLPPREQQVESADGRVRVTVTPRPLAGALPYFQDKVDGKEPAGQREGNEQATPVATLERKDADGRWQVAWTGPLVNDVAPVEVLVANNGRLVTFDNWHSVGYGDDVVVIYDERGKVVRQMALVDLLPAGYIVSLPHSVSSLYWGGEHALVDGERTLELGVVEPGAEFADQEPARVPLQLSMADGQVLPEQGDAWTRALQTVATLDQKRHASWDALRVRRAQPLRVPEGSDTKAWRAYLVELRERLRREADEPIAGAVLPARGEGDFPDREDSIRGMLQDAALGREFLGKRYLLVSPRSDALATLLVDELRSAKPGSMKDVEITFVGSVEDGAAVVAAAATAGASIHLIDKAQPYPGQVLPAAMPETYVER